MKEEEAKQKICCGPPCVAWRAYDQSLTCVGSKCMAWITSPPNGGCTCDLGPGEKPDQCAIDLGDPEDCIYSPQGKGKCGYWKADAPEGYCGLIKEDKS